MACGGCAKRRAERAAAREARMAEKEAARQQALRESSGRPFPHRRRSRQN